MLKQFTTLTTQDSSLNRVQANIESVFNPITKNPFLDFNIVKEVVLNVGVNVVDHKLGRTPVGYVVIRQRSAANIYDKQDTNTTPTKNFLLNSDASVSVDIYFF